MWWYIRTLIAIGAIGAFVVLPFLWLGFLLAFLGASINKLFGA